MRRLIALATAGILVLVACVPRTEPGDTVAGGAATGGAEVTGTVQIVGSAPVNVQVVVQPDQGGPVRVTGRLASEIQRLSGARVLVRGEFASSPDPIANRQMEVDSYEIVSVNDRPVVLGEITEVAVGRARLRTAAGEEVLLSEVPSGFRVGQKVWVQGPQSLVVQSYGMVSP